MRGTPQGDWYIVTMRFSRWSRAFVVVCLAVVAVVVHAGTNVHADGGGLPNSQSEQGASAVAAGNGYNCWIQAGGVKCIGLNSAGQLGDGTTTDRLVAVDVSGLTSGVIQIVAGDSFNCALTSAGAVKCWGSNSSGQLGDGTTTDSSVPVQVSGLTSGVARVEAESESACVLMLTGAVKCWGNNQTYGTATVTADANADGIPDPVLTPVQATGLTSGVASIALGGRRSTPTLYRSHGCAVMQDGTMKCWGNNSFYELGSAAAGPVSSPAVVNIGAFVTIASLTAYGSCAVTLARAVKCWGYNGSGEIGSGDKVGVAAGTFINVINVPSDVIQLASSRASNCAVTSAGALWCWGENYTQTIQRSPNFNDDQPVPQVAFGLTSGVRAAARGATNLCILMVNGDLACSGGSWNGQTGDGFTPLQTTPRSVWTSAANPSPLSGVQRISSMSNAVCAQLTSGGIKCWGSNTNRELGNDEIFSQLAPSDNTDIPAGTGSLGNLNGAGGGTNCAVMTDTTVKCWGSNTTGSKGIGTTATDLTARTMLASTGPDVPLTGVTHVSAGGYTSCVVVSGAAKCVGKNDAGQLGDGTTTYRTIPVQVTGLTSGVSAVSANSSSHSCALMTDGTVRCWGAGTSGQLGNGASLSSTTPVTVSGITNAVAVLTGGSSTCALLATGVVKCWGLNANGALGDGTATNRSTPVSVSGITNATAISGVGYPMCALLATGSVKCWGWGVSGNLGNGTTANSTTPVTVTGITTATAISGSSTQTCALLADTTVQCWGVSTAAGINIGQAHWFDGENWLVRGLSLPTLPTIFTTTTTTSTTTTSTTTTSTTVAPAPVTAAASTTTTSSTSSTVATAASATTSTTLPPIPGSIEPLIERVDDTVYQVPPKSVGTGYTVNAVSKAAIRSTYLVTATPKQCAAGGRTVFALSPGTCRILIRSLENKNAFRVWSTVIKKDDSGVGSSVRESRLVLFSKLSETPLRDSLRDLLIRVGRPQSAVVVGHTAMLTGATEENMILSQHRARNVANVLAKSSPGTRIGWVGLGATVPISRVLTENAQAPNRRVVVYYIP